MSKSSYTWCPAFPNLFQVGPNGDIINHGDQGLSQYAYVAMTLHAAVLAGRDGRYNRSEALIKPDNVAFAAFDQADAFFAELANRTKS